MKKLTDEQIARATRISDVIASVASAVALLSAAAMLIAMLVIGVSFAVREGLL